MRFFESEPLGETIIDAISENSIVEAGTTVVNEGMSEVNDEISTQISFLSDVFKDVPAQLVRFGVKFVFAIIIFFIGSRLIRFVRKIVKKALEKGSVDDAVKNFLDALVKVILYVLLIALIASSFGVETTSMIALLGSAGVAVALALQGSLSNFIGGVLILLLKPFSLGDYIVDGGSGKEGNVIDIHLFNTKLRTVDDRIVIIPNGGLANACIINNNLSPDRRVCMTVGISYNANIKTAKDVISKCVDNIEWRLKDKQVDVYVDDLADSAVIIGFRFYVKNEDYWSARWKIAEDVKNALDKAGVEIPYNQLDVHVKAEDIEKLNIKK